MAQQDSMKIVNKIERHNLCWNDLLTKSNRTEIQTYKEEERTFGTPRMNVIEWKHGQCKSMQALIDLIVADLGEEVKGLGENFKA